MEPVRSNIDVLTYSLVSKVIVDDGNRAIGVEVERFGHHYQYFTSNEVILSAGAIGSAQGLASMQKVVRIMACFLAFLVGKTIIILTY